MDAVKHSTLHTAVSTWHHTVCESYGDSCVCIAMLMASVLLTLCTSLIERIHDAEQVA